MDQSGVTFGGGGSRTLVPWQVDDNLYVHRLHVNLKSPDADSLTSGNSSPSWVLANGR